MPGYDVMAVLLTSGEVTSMKKVIALIVVCAMSFALFGCGKKDDKKGGGDSTKATTQAADKGSDDASGSNDVQFSQKGGQTVFTVDAGLDLKQDAWLGFCPGTKGFVKEADADEVDVLYAYIENGDKKSSDDYLFEFGDDQIDGLEDGDYILVLCDSDDEAVGKVLLYIPCKLSGSKVTLDYDKIVINK